MEIDTDGYRTHNMVFNTWDDIKDYMIGFDILSLYNKLYNELGGQIVKDLQKTSLENTGLFENL